jgi:DNA (cytosine-5)-methyltransferase 1
MSSSRNCRFHITSYECNGVRVLDLFSCIGGHALGLEAAGPFRTVRFCEFNPQRRAYVRAMHPGVPVHDDVRTLQGRRGEADLIFGGPPCQRTSKAAAIHGYRSGQSLWPDMLRIGLDVGVEWFVVEQPPGNQAWEAAVSHDLAAAGYHTARAEFAACDLGAPHIRRRVFILANPCLERLALAWSAIPSEIERFKGSAAAGNHWLEGPPRTLRVANGISHWGDRNAAVEAIGDSNPPGMATVIGRAVMRALSASG